MKYPAVSDIRRHVGAIIAIPAVAFILAALPAAAQTSGRAASADPEAGAIKKSLERKFPGTEIRGVVKSDYFGLYEVQFDDRIVYTDAKVKYVVVGSIFDADAKVNLTEERMRRLNRVDVASLPYDTALKKVKGNGKRKLIVFSDPDCPFCSRLEKTLKGVDDVTIYTFLFPIDPLHPEAARKSRMIWCARDRQKAYDDYFESKALPDNNGDCPNPVASNQALGASLKISATPTLVFADGSVVPGALPSRQLESELERAEAALRRVAAEKK